MTELSLVPLEEQGRPARESGVSAIEGPSSQHMGVPGSPYEAADRTSRELGMYNPPLRSPDAEINGNKATMDARGRDLIRNTGYMQGAQAIHRDSIVGAQFRLNSKPNYKLLGLDDVWAEEFQAEVESKFTLYAESTENWMDAARMNTLTGLVRLSIGLYFSGGEVLAAMEWMKATGRPYRTAVQMIDADRLSNPDDMQDTEYLRRGVEIDSYGAPIAYQIRTSHPNDILMMSPSYKWKRVPIRKPWGRLMMLHIFEQMRPAQHRGISEMVAVLKEMRMTKKYQDVVLQNAVVNATFAAVIESELPPEIAFQQIGLGDTQNNVVAGFLEQIAEYQGGSRNLAIDGAKIPHLYPNTKLNLLNAGSPGGVGENFEASLLRHIARALGVSYEQFSSDYTKTNYSSARASMNETWKFMKSRKKAVADRFANAPYVCWMEEALGRGEITSMPRNPPNFYEGLNKEAYCQATWIGASRGQVDELKETQASMLKLSGNLSTLEEECAREGKDWREVIAQRAREKKVLEDAGLDFAPPPPTKPGTNSAHRGDNNAATTDNGEDDNA